MYAIYVIIMAYNEKIKNWFYGKFITTKQEPNTLLTTEISMKGVPDHDITNTSSYSTIKYDSVQDNEELLDDNDNNSNNDDDEDEAGPDFSWPENSGILSKILYLCKLPINICVYFTLADVTIESGSKYWLWTFFGSLIWLGIFSYFMVWWAVVVGDSWNIPDEIMGLTFLAAGTSVPELFSCILVARKGKADMALSGSVGSNIFDILVGLALPWFTYALIFGNGTCEVKADRLFISICLLVFILIMVLISITLNKWILTHKLGMIMFFLYAFFVTQDLLRHFLNLDQKWFGNGFT